MTEPTLLVLDLDETLYWRADEAAPYHVRPGAAELLRDPGPGITLAVWSHGTADWVEKGLQALQAACGPFELAFTWTREHCGYRWQGGQGVRYKPASRFRRAEARRWPRSRVLCLDDLSSNYPSFGHLIRVTSWEGQPEDPLDNPLLRVRSWLQCLPGGDLRKLEKRHWHHNWAPGHPRTGDAADQRRPEQDRMAQP